MVGLLGIKNNKTAQESGFNTIDKNHFNHQAVRKGEMWGEEPVHRVCCVWSIFKFLNWNFTIQMPAISGKLCTVRFLLSI